MQTHFHVVELPMLQFPFPALEQIAHSRSKGCDQEYCHQNHAEAAPDSQMVDDDPAPCPTI